MARPPLNNAIRFKHSLLLFVSPPPLLLRSINSTSITSRNVSFPAKSSTATGNLLRLRCCCWRAMTTMLQEQQPVQVEVKEKIDLTETEKRIFDRLLGTLRHFNLQTQLRVAGGWVRDKLLGKDCYDIDIALDNMMGSEFVDKVREYLSSTGEEAQGLAVIPCNPDQSKHLETARMRLFDLWIDFVNLRCEDYSENSRIPTMKFGTAEEDAYRRDLTINSLFYNINTCSVEDLTGRGISDLKSGKIVTPLPPKATFLDDPLRVLRAIRFGARFGFILEEQLKEAAASDDVKTALAAKISRERIGSEIDLMISGNEPVKIALFLPYICLLLLSFAFFFSQVCLILPCCIFRSDGKKTVLSLTLYRYCVAYLGAAWSLIQLVGSSNFSDEQRRLSLYAALFLPFRQTTYKNKKAKQVPVTDYIFKESLKRKTSDAETVKNVHNALEKFLFLIPSLVSDEDIQLDDSDWAKEFVDVPVTARVRVLTGFLLREIKESWTVALLMSTLLILSMVTVTQDILNKKFQLDKRKDIFWAVENAIGKLGLDKVWEVKPLVNGKEIMNVLQLKAGGPLVREWQQKLLAWQLAHPCGTAEECLDWMKQSHSKRLRVE
ncbi:LOW QUALITY PROTEIN: putative CCA tRNA nucleotidyltransferase 2 [Carica papaya]|uniref:LOW QUALITY PROTEIN: putative CCA tRNA nucleotidyltransferase 2 n=1 Tax=Carica papaya TaxID=3649 RepID=UPI000B8CAAA2|nr:LOW QUALITY PROTEIN: putative CCA tRNA nucleotidyltransferase 2 [Carica papaya]